MYISKLFEMNNTINQRVDNLRKFLVKEGLDAYIFPSTDPHNGEYIPDYWKTREWISGFNGSAGTAVVTTQQAALWTDSRYFLAAEAQLNGTPFQLMKERLPETPSITEWLTLQLNNGGRVGFDSRVNSFATIEEWKKELAIKDIELIPSSDPTVDLWTGRPEIPRNPIEVQPLDFSGESVTEKLSRLRKIMKAEHAEMLVMTALDEIAWTLNLRGTDIHCNPVFVSYLLLTNQDATLFIYKEKVSPDIARSLANIGIKIADYEDIYAYLEVSKNRSIMMDLSSANYALYQAIPATSDIINRKSPVALMKALKNPTEIAGFHQVMIRDGIALVQFLKWLKPAVATGLETEVSIDQKLTELRSRQPLYRDISFDTIAGYAAHGAIVHYEATEKTDIPLKPEGLLLLDSGAQYQDGTTDITRTIALGPTTPEQKRDYTLVLKGHIALSRAKFPEGTTGTQLDICARYAMWQEGINYLHGTGHGVGSYLNVHEGPHQIRMNHVPTPLCAGMTVTDEPGIYRAGAYGVRIENTLLVVPFKETEFGSFLQFEPLTLCPIDKEPILWDLLDATEIDWLNQYHQTVYDRLAPFLEEEERIWLKEQTAPYSTKK